MNLDQIGARLLPWLDVAVHEAIENLTTFQLYIQAWRRVLDV